MSKSIMIVGAGPGIGQAAARKFGGEGWTVVLTGRRAERLTPLATELSPSGIAIHTVLADATDPAALRAAIAEAERLTSGLTAIHYNGAVARQHDRRFPSSTPRRWSSPSAASCRAADRAA